MLNARNHEAHQNNFTPRRAGYMRPSGNIRRLRPNTIRLAVRPVAPRLVDGGDGFTDTGSVPPPFDGILSLLELLERGAQPGSQGDTPPDLHS